MEEKLHVLMEENEQLRKDKEELTGIVNQMNIILNRLLDRYIIGPEYSSGE